MLNCSSGIYPVCIPVPLFPYPTSSNTNNNPFLFINFVPLDLALAYAAMTSIFLPLTDFHSTANDPTIDSVANAAAT